MTSLFSRPCRNVFFTLSLLLLVSVSTSHAAPTELEQTMKGMGKAFKELAGDLKDPKDEAKDSYVKLAGDIKDGATKARDLIPKMAESVPPEQRDEFVQNYKKDMDKFLGKVDVLTAALQEGRWDDARKDMDDLKESMRDGHKTYIQKRKS